MAPGRLRTFVAAASLVALSSAAAPHAAADALASWSGRVIQSDRAAPREGVVVHLTRSAGEGAVALRSEPTRSDGAFTFDAAPAGAYALRVETPEGVFAASEPLELGPGPNTPVALALTAGLPSAKQEHGIGDGQVSRTTEWILAGVVAVVALFVYQQVTEDEDEVPSSVF